MRNLRRVHSLAYTGMRPTFYVESFYKRRGLNSENPFHEITAMAGAYFPANLSRSGLWNHKLTFGISGGAWWADTNSITPILYYRARWYRLRGGSKRALKPELGWYLTGTYAHIPLIEHYGDSITGELILYLPGGFRNTFLSLRGGIERRTANISSQLGSARGYDWLNPGLTVLTSVDYEFPLAYPDWPIGAFFYVQRFRLGIHSDFAWVGDSNALSTGGPFSRQWSSGIALTIDFAAFNSFSGMSLGMELNWRWQIQSFAFDITLEGLPIF